MLNIIRFFIYSAIFNIIIRLFQNNFRKLKLIFAPSENIFNIVIQNVSVCIQYIRAT